MRPISYRLQRGDALLIIDVQNDFFRGGAIPIAGADRILPVINRWIETAIANRVRIYVSREWHPVGHISFRDQGGTWPVHCIQDSHGARIHPDLKFPASAIKVTKGCRFDRDQYSAFDRTGLSVQLRNDGIRRLWVAGLVQEFAVRCSVLDALRLGFDTVLINDAIGSMSQLTGARVRRELVAAGAEVLSAKMGEPLAAGAVNRRNVVDIRDHRFARAERKLL